nr:putative ribonuclease H-like domain-containing protein [Tanacetum cinerariifolium]
MKDETSRILKSKITKIENLVDKKVKIIRCDRGTKFKNRVMNEFYEEKGDGPKWLFNIDTLTESIDYVPVSAGTHFNDFVGKGASFDADSDGENLDTDGSSTESKVDNQKMPNDENSTKYINIIRPSINTASSNVNTASLTVNTVRLSDDYFSANNDMRSLDGVELNISNLSTTYLVLTTLNTRINKDHSLDNMDVKSAFLYERIKEEVYVCQPPWFEDPDYPDKVYKVEKALYGLHQAPSAWYETLAKYLLDNGFRRGKIDQTLFIKRQKEDILLIQVYVDDIIFGSTKKELCIEFEVLMHDKFQISSMRELTFFLGLQVKQKSDGTFISQDKYVDEILRKFKSMIGSLMYLTSSRPDIMFTIDIMACKKQTMVATSTTEAEYVAAASCYGQVLWIQNQLLDYGTLDNGEIKLNATVDDQVKTITEASVRRHLKLADVDVEIFDPYHPSLSKSKENFWGTI